jgi:DNA-binding GntR family transcriptional regulator
MAQVMTSPERRTNADDVFDHLYGQIVSLELLPGTRISEVEVSKQFDVSRQPVREAFIRLANLDLLLVRPQKATVVRRFSSERIKTARFVRVSVESEVLRRACLVAEDAGFDQLERDLDDQRTAIAAKDVDRFHSLDYDFHAHLSEVAGCGFMFGTIAENKAMVDRLCVLSLSAPAAMDELLEDHKVIVDALKARDEEAVQKAIRAHLSRLDDVITGIRKSHADYFED